MTIQDLLRYRASTLKLDGQYARANDPELLADSLSCENFAAGRIGGELLRAVVAFRHLNQAARVAAARRTIAAPVKPPVEEPAREAAHRAFRAASDAPHCPRNAHSNLCDAVTEEIERARAAQ